MATTGEKKTRPKSVIETPEPSADPVAQSMAPAPLPVVEAAAEPEVVPTDAAPVAEAEQPDDHAAAPDAPAPEADLADLPVVAPAAAEMLADTNPASVDAPNEPAAPPLAASETADATATAPAAEPVFVRRFVPEPANPTPSAAAASDATPKEPPMADTFTTAADAMKNGAEQMKSTMASHTENAMATGKATMDQVATKSREALEQGMKSVDDMAGMARGNVEAMLASSKTAASGIEAISKQVSDFARKSFEETTAAARAMTTVKTPNELMQLQNDFAKTQFDAVVAEMSKLSETMVKLMGEVFQPMQERAAVATDKLKSAITTPPSA